jgi:hypothetical protein
MQAMLLIKKSLLFLLLNGGILAVVLGIASGAHRDLHMDNGETESNLLVMGGGHVPAHYGVALLGTSRGRIFSRDHNHQLVEKILGQKVINLSKGGGGGLMPAELHLSYFYHLGNRVDNVVYLVDPWVFFSPINNEENDFFLRDEPFELYILWKLIAEGYPFNRISSYLQMITVRDWRSISTYAGPGLTEGTLKYIDQKKLIEARDHYLSKYVENGFEKYSRYVDIINAKVKQEGGRITYLMLPMLIPDFPGMDQVDQKLRQAADRNDNVAYYDLSDAMHDRRYFYDHMHFNKTGIAFFTRHVIDPVLHGEKPLM